MKKQILITLATALVYTSTYPADDGYSTDTDLGVSAIADLEILEGQGSVKQDGSYYKVERIEDLPTRVKPGAIIEIKKERPDMSDSDKIVHIRDVINPQTGNSVIIQQPDKQNSKYYTVKVPDNTRSMEIEMLFLMGSKDEKYALYKYWPQAHTFEVQQGNEDWVF